MGATSSLDLVIEPLESGMPRLVLQLVSLSKGSMGRRLLSQWAAYHLRIPRRDYSNLGCRDRCRGWQGPRGAQKTCAVRRLLSQWAAYHLRIRIWDYSNLGCREGCRSRQASRGAYRGGALRRLLS